MDSGIEFDLISLLGDKSLQLEDQSEESEGSQTLESASPLSFTQFPDLDEIPLDIDLLLQTLPSNLSNSPSPLPLIERSRAIVVHSMVDCLIELLLSLVEPVIPYSVQDSCLSEGYNNMQIATALIFQLDDKNKHLYCYLVSFLKDFCSNYTGSIPLSWKKVASKFAPALLKPQIMKNQPSKFATISGTSLDRYSRPPKEREYLKVRKEMFLEQFLKN